MPKCVVMSCWTLSAFSFILICTIANSVGESALLKKKWLLLCLDFEAWEENVGVKIYYSHARQCVSYGLSVSLVRKWVRNVKYVLVENIAYRLAKKKLR